MMIRFGEKIYSDLLDFARDEKGVTAIEYGMIAFMVAIGILAAYYSITDKVGLMYEHILAAIPDV